MMSAGRLIAGMVLLLMWVAPPVSEVAAQRPSSPSLGLDEEGALRYAGFPAVSRDGTRLVLLQVVPHRGLIDAARLLVVRTRGAARLERVDLGAAARPRRAAVRAARSVLGARRYVSLAREPDEGGRAPRLVPRGHVPTGPRAWRCLRTPPVVPMDERRYVDEARGVLVVERRFTGIDGCSLPRATAVATDFLLFSFAADRREDPLHYSGHNW